MTDPVAKSTRGRSLPIVLALALPILALAAPASAARYTDRFEQTYEVASGAEVYLANTNGTVTVETWNGSAVEVVAEKIVDAHSRSAAEEAFEKIEIIVSESAGGLRIETEHPSASSGLVDWLFGRARNASVRYSLRIPSDVELEVRTVNGGVKTIGGAGPQLLRSTNGRIDVRDAHGRVDASTTNGGITAEIAYAPSRLDVRLASTNGGLELRLPEDSRARLEARTTNGSVRSDLPVLTHRTTSRRKLEGGLNGGDSGDGRIELRTVNGGIRIEESAR